MKYDVVIIGSGVAGLTAGLYSARANKKVLIIEDGDIGGIVTTLEKVENYPGFESINGFELIQKMYMQVLNAGVTFEFEKINSIDFDNKIINCDNTQIEYLSLIIATGSSYKKLNIEGEKEFSHKGVSYCAICDGNLYRNKKIVLITSGELGRSSYNYLKNITNNITIFDISNNVLYGDTIIHNVTICKFLGKEKLEKIDYLENTKMNSIDCDAVFIALGRESNLSLFCDKLRINGNYIVSDENMHTNIKSVYVAGDIREKSLRQIITACSDGAIAATEAIKELN